MPDTTILYLTDGSLEATIAPRVREWLITAAEDIPIVSVTQQPLTFGQNICVGNIGRSWLSIHKQLLAGLQAAQTTFVHIAEHDCLYTHEHFAWTPPTLNPQFWCNANCWLVEWGGNHPELDGMYSYWPSRSAMSQTVCSREVWIAYTEDRINALERNPAAHKIATSGLPTQMQGLFRGELADLPSSFFRTRQPNLDIRHKANFTGPKRGKKRCWTLPPWGKFAEVINGA